MKVSTVKTIGTSFLVVLFAFITMGQQGCFDTLAPKPPTTPLLPKATPEDMWQYITEDNPYTDWSTFPLERITPEAVWHDDYIFSFLEGQVIKIYVNDICLAALDEEPRDLPDGSIILVDVYPMMEEKGEVGEKWLITGFYKVKGSTAQDNDWVSFGYNPDGSLFQADEGPIFGTKTHCYSCHEAAENDYIWIDSPKFDIEHTQMPAESPPRP